MPGETRPGAGDWQNVSDAAGGIGYDDGDNPVVLCRRSRCPESGCQRRHGKNAGKGAGIQQSPNAVRVLRGLGIEDRLRQVAFHPASSLNRDAASGAVTNDQPVDPRLRETLLF